MRCASIITVDKIRPVVPHVGRSLAGAHGLILAALTLADGPACVAAPPDVGFCSNLGPCEIHGGTGRSPFSAPCPANNFVDGIEVCAGDWIDGIGAACAAFKLNTNLTVPLPVKTRCTGGAGGQPKSYRCSPNHYVSGLKYGFARDGNRAKYLDNVEVFCTPLSVSGKVSIGCLDSGDGCWDRHPNPGPYNGFGLAFESCCVLVGCSGSFVDAPAVACDWRPVKPRPPGIASVVR